MNSIKLLFKSLVSNQAAIDNRKMKWYITIVVLIFSVFLPWIPVLSSGYTSNGGTIFTSSNYEVSTALKHVIAEEAYFKEINVKDENGNFYFDMNFSSDNYSTHSDKVDDSEIGWSTEYNGKNPKALYKSQYKDDATSVITNSTSLSYEYYFDAVGVDVLVDKTSTDSSSTTTEKVQERRVYLEAYYFPELSSTDENCAQYLSNFVVSIVLDQDAQGVIHQAPRSYMVVLKDYLQVIFYPYTSTTETTSYSGYYTGLVNEGLKSLGGETGRSITFYNLLTNNGTLNIDEAYETNFVSFADKSARKYTIANVWRNILIVSIAVVATILINSILLIVFFKRKSSIYRDSNYWHAINTAVSMSLCPSLIAMVIGFMSSNYTTMVIVAANLIRAIFSMNKISPPSNDQAASSKPVYQARS